MDWMISFCKRMISSLRLVSMLHLFGKIGGTERDGGYGGYGTFLSQESTKEPVCDVKADWVKLEGGIAA